MPFCIKASASEQVQGTVQVNLLPHLQLVFRPHKVVQQHLKDHGAPQAPPFDLELGEPVFQVHFLYIPDSDESVFLKLDIPEGFYILANNEVWDYMINHLYYPESRSDETAHEAELERYGISSPSSLVGGNTGNFYPLLRKKVTKSWEKIFTVMPDDSNQIVGLAWELRREWLI